MKKQNSLKLVRNVKICPSILKVKIRKKIPHKSFEILQTYRPKKNERNEENKIRIC